MLYTRSTLPTQVGDGAGNVTNGANFILLIINLLFYTLFYKNDVIYQYVIFQYHFLSL